MRTEEFFPCAAGPCGYARWTWPELFFPLRRVSRANLTRAHMQLVAISRAVQVIIIISPLPPSETRTSNRIQSSVSHADAAVAEDGKPTKDNDSFEWTARPACVFHMEWCDKNSSVSFFPWEQIDVLGVLGYWLVWLKNPRKEIVSWEIYIG